MDNVLRQAASIRDDGVFTGTVAADREAPTAATRNIAAAAAGLLLDRSWTGTGEVPVLGPESLSANDMAHIMSDVLGHPVRSKDDGLDDGVRRTPRTASPTTFREWCAEVLKPAVQA